MSLEEQLKDIINERYKSIRTFAKEHDIPYSKLANLFRQTRADALMNTGVSFVLQICDILSIDPMSIREGRLRIVEKSLFDVSSLSYEEKTLVLRYREQEEMRSAVKRLLRMD